MEEIYKKICRNEDGLWVESFIPAHTYHLKFEGLCLFFGIIGAQIIICRVAGGFYDLFLIVTSIITAAAFLGALILRRKFSAVYRAELNYLKDISAFFGGLDRGRYVVVDKWEERRQKEGSDVESN